MFIELTLKAKIEYGPKKGTIEESKVLCNTDNINNIFSDLTDNSLCKSHIYFTGEEESTAVFESQQEIMAIMANKDIPLRKVPPE